ncbi:adenosylcobinamide-GDP ribazoletransferase, partial [Roseomonas mucosa]
DTADGFGGGRGRARKLEIMRDSRIGSYGVLALALSLGIRGLALAAMPRPWAMVASLVVSGALGRGAILGVLALAPPARPDGLAALLGRPGAGLLAGGLALAALPALLLLPLPVALGGILLTGLCALGMARLACRQVGGHTGDVLGACEQLAEAVVLSLLAASLGHWAGPG